MSKPMFCRKYTTYNTHDSSVSVDSRIRIRNGVIRRLDIAFEAVLKHKKEVNCFKLTEEINLEHNAQYSASDIEYALKRLCDEAKVLVRTKKNTYRAIPSARRLWDSIERIEVPRNR